MLSHRLSAACRNKRRKRTDVETSFAVAASADNFCKSGSFERKLSLFARENTCASCHFACCRSFCCHRSENCACNALVQCSVGKIFHKKGCSFFVEIFFSAKLIKNVCYRKIFAAVVE